MNEKLRDEIVDVLLGVWGAIDWSKYGPTMLRRIYAFYGDRLRATANQTETYSRFVDVLSYRMNSAAPKVPLAVSDEKAFLNACRQEQAYLIAAFRQRVEDKKTKKKGDKNGADQDRRSDQTAFAALSQ